MFHSNRGSQFVSEDLAEELQDVTISMSRKGNCWDNAVSESSFRSPELLSLGRLSMSVIGQTRKMLLKITQSYLLVLIASLIANYMLALAFPELIVSDTSYIELLAWIAALSLIPFVFGLVVSGIYSAIKRSKFHYFMKTVWFSWLVIYTIPFIGMYLISGPNL